MLTDAQIHEQALAHARKHNVSYHDALRAIGEQIAQGLLNDTNPLEKSPAVASSDAELDTQAKAYAKAHNVSYSEAIGVVCGQAVASFERTASFSDAGRTAGASESGALTDAQMHEQALAHARDNNLSYSDALKAISEQLLQRFLKATQPPSATSAIADAALDAQAKAYAKAHNVSYSEAIGTVCDQAVASFGEFASFSESSVSTGGELAARSLEGQLIEIFKAGRHTSDSGESLDFSSADIRDMADCYSPAMREAPLTVGHPASNLPAYGWVKGLTATADGRLLMRPGQVDANFAEMVKSGRFKKRSASFYPPNHPSNPRPGKWYLRHVGWLGAQQPAIAGLKDLAL